MPSPSTPHDASAGAVVRSRLLGVLAGRFERRVTLVEAGPGFGKTTVLDQALAEQARTGDDRDVVVDVPPGGLTAPALLERLLAGLGSSGGVVPSVDALADAVWSAAPSHVCLVVDDVHRLDDEVAAGLAELASRLPANGHVLLSGRRLPAVAVGDDRGSVARIGEDQLAFDADERAALAVRLGLDPAEVTTGWPALAVLGASPSTMAPAAVTSYLAREVLTPLGPARREQLARIAVLDEVDDDLVEQLVGPGVHLATLTRDVPLTSRSPDGAIRLHDLLRTALLADRDDDEVARWCTAAADAVRRRGRDDEALHLYRRAGAHDRLAAMVRDLAGELQFGSPPAPRLALVDELRAELGDRLELAVITAIVAARARPLASRPALEEVADRAAAAAEPDLEALCRIHLAAGAFTAVDRDALAAAHDRLEELAGFGSGIAARVGWLGAMWVAKLADRDADVTHLLAARRRAAADAGDRALAGLIATYELTERAHRGHVRTALDQLSSLPPPPPGVLRSVLDGFRHVHRWMLGELGADEIATAVAIIDRAEQEGHVAMSVTGAARTAQMCCSFGDLELADTLLERAAARVDSLRPEAQGHHLLAQARAARALVEGDEQRAAAALRGVLAEGSIAGVPREVYAPSLPMTYALVPETRPAFDAVTVGPDEVLPRQVAAALVALREHGDPSLARRLPWDRLDRLRPWAIGTHLVELAVAGCAPDVALEVLRSASLDPRAHLEQLVTREGRVGERAAGLVRQAPRRPGHRLEVSVLGPTALRRGALAVSDDDWVRRARVRQLLGVLVHHRRIARSQAAELLWPDKEAAAADANLRFTLSKLVAVLEPERETSEPSWFVRSEGDLLLLGGADRLHVDVDRFRAELDRAVRHDAEQRPHQALELYRRACDRYDGDYLADPEPPEWAYYEALALRGRFVAAATRATGLLVGLDELDEAEALAVRATAAEPANEAAQRSLVHVLLARRRVGAAREVLGRLLNVLTELEVDPEPETARMASRLGLTAGRRG